MLELMRKLLMMRVRPYYLYQADITKGANHFRTPVSVGLNIMDKLRGHTSGLAIPHFVIDAPGGGGKIPLLPQYVLGRSGNNIILRNYKYDIYQYPDVEEEEKKPETQLEKRYMRKLTKPMRKKAVRNPADARRGVCKIEFMVPFPPNGTFDFETSMPRLVHHCSAMSRKISRRPFMNQTL